MNIKIMPPYHFIDKSRNFKRQLKKIICKFLYPFPLEKGHTNFGHKGTMRNIQDRYRQVYVFLIRKQKQYFFANVRLFVRPKNFCTLKLENGYR